MAIKDEEDLLRDLHTFFKANLNIRIAAINVEHSDFSIDAIKADDRHYVFAGELTELPNHIFCEFWIEDEILTENNQGNLKSEVNIRVEVAFDNPKKANTYFKSLRYMRALYETALTYEPSASEVGGLQRTKAVPMSVEANEREIVVSGVGISVAIG